MEPEWPMNEIREALAMPEPCAIDFLAAISDSEIANRIARRREAGRQFASILARVSDDIYQRTLEGRATEIIVHPEVARLIESLVGDE